MKTPEEILNIVGEALDYQFEIYSWFAMIDDIQDLTEEEKNYAKEEISYKAYMG